MARLIDRMEDDIAREMIRKFGYKNKLESPRLEKIVINAGLGEANDEPKLMEQALGDIALIAGQKPVVALARKAIAGFKLRKGQKVGCFVTLRRGRMYDFMERLVRVYLPRVRDFRGLPLSSFDGSGNYTLGLREQSIFPELDRDKIEHVFGLSVTIVTTADNDAAAEELLRQAGMPFRKAENE